MKKILSIILSFCLILPICLLSGCEDENKYWLETETALTELLADTNYVHFFGDTPIPYILNDSDLRTDFTSSSYYDNITNDYEKLLKASFTRAKAHVSNLGLKPEIKDKQAKPYFEKLNSAITTLKADIANFEQQKQVFINNIDRTKINETGIGAQDQNLQALRNFARCYKTFLGNSLVFAKAFDDLFDNVYLNLPTEQTTNDVSLTTMNTINYKYISLLTNCTFQYISEFDVVNEPTHFVNCLPNIQAIQNKISVQTSCTWDVYFAQKQQLDAFVSQSNIFKNALANLDTLKYINNTDNYRSENSSYASYYDVIQYYLNIVF